MADHVGHAPGGPEQGEERGRENLEGPVEESWHREARAWAKGRPGTFRDTRVKRVELPRGPGQRPWCTTISITDSEMQAEWGLVSPYFCVEPLKACLLIHEVRIIKMVFPPS